MDCPLCAAGVPAKKKRVLTLVDGSGYLEVSEEFYQKLVVLTEVIHRDELIRAAQRRFRTTKARIKSWANPNNPMTWAVTRSLSMNALAPQQRRRLRTR